MSLRDALSKPLLMRRAPTERRTILADGRLTLTRLLMPDGVARRPDGRALQVGDSWVATLEVVQFAPELDLAWLSHPSLGLIQPGITIQQQLIPVPDGEARRILRASRDAGLRTLGFDAGDQQTSDTAADQAVDAAGELLRAIADGTDRLARYVVTITVAAASWEALEQRVWQIREQLASTGTLLRTTQFQQWEGYQASLPLGLAGALGRHHDASMAAVAMGMPVAASSLRLRGGSPLLWGEHLRSGEPILYDRWQATNPHMVVVAESGSGKSYAMRGLIAQEVALGEEAVLILDPKYQEYRQLCQLMGGTYLTLSANAGYHLNPLDLPPVTPARAAAVAALNEDLLGQRIAMVKALIVRELRAQDMLVDAVAQHILEEAIQQSYARNGITRDVATWVRPMPTFGTIQQVLAAQAEADPNVLPLARAMKLFTTGMVGDLFNHPSSVPTDNPLLAIDLSALLATQDEVLSRLIPVIVMDFFTRTAINKPTGRKYHLVLDEAHAMLHTDAGARTLQLIVRVGRSLGFKASLISQSLSDFNDSPVTQTLLENTRTKLILGLNAESGAVQRAQGLLGLNDQEVSYVAQCRMEKGVGSEALLVADGDRVPLYLRRWPDVIHRLASV